MKKSPEIEQKGNVMMASKKYYLALAMSLLSMTAYGEDDLPPGISMKAFRAGLVTNNVDMCAKGGYPELKGNSPLLKKFCQCVYENHYAKFSDAELMRTLEAPGEIRRDSELGDSEKNEMRRRSESIEQRLTESETQCMSQLKVSVTPTFKRGLK
jgi:hypothetical protein